jgi:hypothetical protein
VPASCDGPDLRPLAAGLAPVMIIIGCEHTRSSMPPLLLLINGEDGLL